MTNEQAYQALIARVRLLDPAAAEYMDGPARELPYFTPTGKLNAAFRWHQTQQGWRYWADLREQIDPTAEVLLQRAIDDWPEFDTDEPVDGADLVEWFAEWREQAKKVLEET